MSQHEPLEAEQPSGGSADAPPEASLRLLSMRGGAYLLLRGGTGIFIRLVGALLVTRLIGPYDFGLFASAAAFLTLLATVAQMGIEIYLIRAQDEPDERTYRTAFTLLLVTSLAAMALGLIGIAVVSLAGHPPPYLPAFEVLLLSIPVNICWAPAQARIERRFEYRKMAAIELIGDVALYASSVPLAALGAGVWAPTIGYVVWQTFLFGASLWVAGAAPGLAWDGAEVKRMLRFGGAYSVTATVGSVVGLVNPLVVGHYYGPTGVGYVTLTQRLLTTLGFVNQAAWRLATVALGRVRDDLARLRRGLEEAMTLQVVVLGPLLVGFAVASAVLVPALFGHSWSGIVGIYPWLSLGALFGAVALIPQALLFTRNKNMTVALSQAVTLVVLVPLAIVLTANFGLAGFAVAFLISRIGSLVVVIVAHRIVPISYMGLIPWLLAFSPGLFIQSVNSVWRFLLLAPIVIVLLVPRTRHQLFEYVKISLGSLRRQPA